MIISPSSTSLCPWLLSVTPTKNQLQFGTSPAQRCYNYKSNSGYTYNSNSISLELVAGDY